VGVDEESKIANYWSKEHDDLPGVTLKLGGRHLLGM